MSPREEGPYSMVKQTGFEKFPGLLPPGSGGPIANSWKITGVGVGTVGGTTMLTVLGIVPIGNNHHGEPRSKNRALPESRLNDLQPALPCDVSAR